MPSSVHEQLARVDLIDADVVRRYCAVCGGAEVGELEGLPLEWLILTIHEQVELHLLVNQHPRVKTEFGGEVRGTPWKNRWLLDCECLKRTHLLHSYKSVHWASAPNYHPFSPICTSRPH